MLKMIRKSYKVVAIASAFILVGCGGGGGAPETVNLPSKPDSSQMAKIDDNNARQTALSAYKSIDQPEDLDVTQMGREFSSNNVIYKSAKLLKRSEKKYDASSQCDSGSASAVQTGEYSVTIEYNNCRTNGLTLDGKVKYSEDEYGSREIEYSNFTAKNTNLNLYIEIKHMYYYVDGTTNGETIKDTYATYKLGREVLKYFNYSSQKEGGTFKFKGYVKPVCLSGYVYIESKDKLVNTTFYGEDYEKPEIKGRFFIKSSNKDIKVDVDKDLVFITLPNKNVEVYSYDDIVNAMKLDSCNVAIKQTLPYRPNSNDFIKLTDDNSANTKVASAMYNASNLNFESDFPKLKEILSSLDSGLSCISGDVQEDDNGDKIDATYKNCEISSGVFYDGNISFELKDGNISKMTLRNLEIEHNSKISNIQYAKVHQFFKDSTDVGVDKYFNIENLHASINQNQYLDFNFTQITNDTQNHERNDKVFSGYIKTSCLGKYAYTDTTLMIYDLTDNIILGDFEVSDSYVDNSDEVDDGLRVSVDGYENSVEITLLSDPQSFTVTVDEFLNSCK